MHSMFQTHIQLRENSKSKMINRPKNRNRLRNQVNQMKSRPRNLKMKWKMKSTIKYHFKMPNKAKLLHKNLM